MTETFDANDITISHAHFLESWAIQTDCAVRGGHQYRHGILMTQCNLPHAAFNRIFISDSLPPDQLKGTISQAQQFFKIRKLPYELCIHEHHQEWLKDVLPSLGVVPLYSQPGMILPPNAPLEPTPDHLEYITVSNRAQLDQFNQLIAAAYNTCPTRGIKPLITMKLASHDACTLIMGQLKGEPVCTAAVVYTHGVAGLYWISTPPQHRRKGYGRSITIAATQMSLAQDSRFVCLQSSEDGANIYRGLGYETVYNYQLYVPRSQVKSQN